MSDRGNARISEANQLNLFSRHDEQTLRSTLQCRLGGEVSLTVTDNTTCMLTSRKSESGFSIRIHRMFLQAGDETILAVADFVSGRRGSRRIVTSYIRSNVMPFQRSAGNRTARTSGVHHCLKRLYQKVNEDCFQGGVSASITWGRRERRGRSRRITLGSYSRETDTIRINPILDRKTVPAYFLEFVIYHEMLHAVLGIECCNGRRILHSPDFRMREKQFPDFEKARTWEENHFHTGTAR